jgi:hypothetical protein
MKRWVDALISVLGGSLVFAAPAAATQSVTKQLPGVPCSVTSSYTFFLSARAMNYAGGVSCAGGVGQKILNVVPQVYNVVNGKPLWFNISLAGLYQGPTPVNPVRLSADRAAVIGHVYRVLAYGRVTLPNGKTAWATACSGTCSDSPELLINGTNRYAPQLPVTIKVGGSPCFVTEAGPVFTLVNGSYVMSYGGRLVCANASASKSLTIAAEVAGSGVNGGKYFMISGSGLSAGPTTRNPVALDTARTTYLGHGYRIKASAKLTYNGKTYTATAYSRTFAP